MNRRTFVTSGALGAAGTACAGDPDRPAPQRPPIKMHAGAQRSPTNREILQFLKRHGVNHCCGYPPHPGERGHWLREDLERTRDLCAEHGVALDMVALPFLASSHIDREERGAIMLADSPERDRDIEDIHKMIQGCAEAGIPALKYNMSILGVLRTERTPGRGGSTYSTWRLEEARPDPPQTRAGIVDADAAWERITYFLDRVVPVANEHGIRIACHPHDPGVPPEGYQGVARVLGTPEGLYRFMGIQESPFHGFNLCIGTTSEMLQNPATEIHEVVRRIGGAGKIFNIHFRNIRGKRDSFQEVYPDEGDINMVEVAKTLWEVDYPYMVMPDHMPQHADDPNGRQAFAYGFGYINGILQALSDSA